MKRSTVLLVSGLFATLAELLAMAWTALVPLDGCRVLLESFPELSMRMVQAVGCITPWGLFALAFIILTGDRKNSCSAVMGCLSCVGCGVIMALGYFGNFHHWFWGVVYWHLVLGYVFSVAFLRTAVPSWLKGLAVVAVIVFALIELGGTSINICCDFVTYGSADYEEVVLLAKEYWQVAIWICLGCQSVLAAFYLAQAITSGNAREQAVESSKADEVTCRAKAADAVGCSVREADAADSARRTATLKAIIADTRELACPSCGRPCEVPVTLAEGQHLICPHCNERFAYHHCEGGNAVSR